MMMMMMMMDMFSDYRQRNRTSGVSVRGRVPSCDHVIHSDHNSRPQKVRDRSSLGVRRPSITSRGGLNVLYLVVQDNI